MSDIISMHRADLVDAVTEAVKPLKARIDSLEAELAAEKMQHSVTIADEHESRTAFQDGIRAIEAELIGEMKLRQTAEAYAARNALRVIAVEAALQLIGNELSLQADKGPAGEAFRALLNPTLPETACEHDFATYFINNAKFPSDPPSVTSWVKCRKCGTYPRDANV